MDEAPDPPRIAALIRWAAREIASSPTPFLDARVLAKCAFGLDDVGLIADGNRIVDETSVDRFRRMVERRTRDEPVAYIVGRREFWSLDIETARGVLVPRSDSETLIEAVIARRDRSEPLRILDLGAGTGALLCALLSEFPEAQGLGVDINPEAVALAGRNLAKCGLSDRSRAQESDWFNAVSGSFDIIVSNPPYIPTGERESLPREVADYESPLALFAGADGLDAYRRILAAAAAFLEPDGLLAAEFGAGQAETVKHMAERAFPAARIAVEPDLSGRPRVVTIDLKRPSN
ncbi:MAG TPA: peptide chain release factor N(5)-glutamine methyltransferase [Parvularculaceae bacterium]|nr:peptide chain release factor N(5)-glutamine methyltransferase [Parvularculaceae bacterium]